MAISSPVPAVGVICLRRGEVLLIRRATPPLRGQWSLPGGRIRWGETLVDAALRELREEAGVKAEILGLVDAVDGVFRSPEGAVDAHYVLIDFAARWLAGEPRAGDDASEARFFPSGALAAAQLWGPTAAVIEKARKQWS